jgi:hypothetical protein
MSNIFLLIVVIFALLNSGTIFAHPSHDYHADMKWKEELSLYCVGHGADHPEGYLRVTELMRDFHTHIADIEGLIEEIMDDRPLSRLSYYIHNAALSKTSKELLLRKCFNKSISNNWFEAQYFFVSETNVLSFEELLTAEKSANESVASAAKRAMTEKRYTSRSQSGGSNKEVRTTGLITTEKEEIFKNPLLLCALIFVISITLISVRIFRTKSSAKSK